LSSGGQEGKKLLSLQDTCPGLKADHLWRDYEETAQILHGGREEKGGVERERIRKGPLGTDGS